MTKKNILMIKRNFAFLMAVVFLSTLVFSCSDDDDKKSGPAYFEIEGEPTGLTLGVDGNEDKPNSYVVRSNRSWEIVPDSDADWFKIFPEEGDDDGIFKIYVKENLTLDERVVNLSFIVDGVEQSVLFRVEQDANVPFLSIVNADKGVSIPSREGEFSLSIKANVEWEYTVENGEWMSEVERTDTKLTFSAPYNLDSERTATLKITSPTNPELTDEVKITQSSGSVFLEENFDWLGEGAPEVINVTTGEKNFKDWVASYGTDNGWTSTPVADTGGGMGQWVYSRLGFIKFGKASVNGDLITPKLSGIEESQDVVVSFKAIAYLSVAAGAIDAGDLNVEVIGPGQITEILKVGSQAEPEHGKEYLDADDNVQESSGRITDNGALFILGNYCNTDGPARKLWFGEDYDPWKPELSERSFVVSGATSETQIRFLPGKKLGVDDKSYRHGLDDVRIELKRD